MGFLSYFSRSERQQRRLDKFRRKLPPAVATQCEASSQGDELLRALKCLEKIDRKWGPLQDSADLETLVDAVLRESAVGVPQVRDVITVYFDTDYGFGWHLSPKDDVARQVNDRLLINIKIDESVTYDYSYIGSGGDVHEDRISYKYGIYGYVVGEFLARRDVVRLLQQAGSSDKLNLSGFYLEGINLSGLDLGGADLHVVNLKKSNLSKANLVGANLSRAFLNGANLSRADLSEANLSRADLSEANLSGANLSEVNLSGANLREATMPNGSLYQP